MRRAFDCIGKFVIIQRDELISLGWIKYPDEAGTKAGQRHQGERPGGSMEFS